LKIKPAECCCPAGLPFLALVSRNSSYNAEPDTKIKPLNVEIKLSDIKIKLADLQ
jgi:hypothetical protein